jgi:hypothetical protein
MRNVFAQSSPQRALTKENDLRQTLLFYRSHPALGIAFKFGLRAGRGSVFT